MTPKNWDTNTTNQLLQALIAHGALTSPSPGRPFSTVTGWDAIIAEMVQHGHNFTKVSMQSSADGSDTARPAAGPASPSATAVPAPSRSRHSDSAGSFSSRPAPRAPVSAGQLDGREEYKDNIDAVSKDERAKTLNMLKHRLVVIRERSFRSILRGFSYTWDELSFTEDLIASKESLMKIESNLRDTLVRSRHPFDVRMTWVNVMRVNQTDDEKP
ncbi:uncharacterized protein BCR38DRAFT_412901 [Pseudomassariella vexata]|uniref:Uncharacterized protein n=1 Tax=Pseudomassariella vexata TaxID=1141098 RepID=A0A1Y2DJ41_9PEZI|nr:uncharacterized protein BCR38DRAFT_412901 [Pseudomassariella vexata]ORY59196.1 hypothetical protein BCR38DRAFT_412901 [Pseudomassariella vexata]